MKNVLHLLSAALLAAHASPAFAESDFQQWLTVAARADIGTSGAVQGESTVRFGNDSNGLYEIENALLLGYELPARVTVWAGYVHNPTYDGGDFTVTEHRARQQVTIDDVAQLGPLSLSVRLRLEQRWRDTVDGTGWRVRPYLQAEFPLGDNNHPILNFTMEPFFNLNTTSFQSDAGLDRMRAAASISLPVADVVRLEAGYLNQHRFVAGGEDVGEHALTVSLAFAL